MRYLGIDYGEKRVGIAVSDEGGTFAFPKIVLENRPVVRERWGSKGKSEHDRHIINEIKNIISSERVSTVVLGLPLNFKGEETRQTKRVKAFAEKLKREISAPIVFENEILSSKQVEKTGASSKDMVDASAAALILQSFLDRSRRG